MKTKRTVEVPDRLVLHSGLSKNKQMETKIFVEELHQVIDVIKSLDYLPAREWKACPCFEKQVGNEHQETVNMIS